MIVSLFIPKLQATFGICNIAAKYTDDAGDSVNIDSQGMNQSTCHLSLGGSGSEGREQWSCKKYSLVMFGYCS